ncbi:kinase-like domain-containing protein [Spinellus fusiger]|nr:kinase-like domain-containing protein [Spinellus fusiger]
MKFFRNRQPEVSTGKISSKERRSFQLTKIISSLFLFLCKKTKQSQLDSRYIILRIVGQGSFGKVYVAKQKDTNRIVAIKVMDMSSFVNDDQIMHANNERDICKKLISSLKHDNIIDIIEVIDDGVNLFIVMEYMDGGELYKLLKREHHLSETQAKVWFKEIIEAVDYIHKNNIVHRDLKPENVLVTENNHMKLCDFGFGRTIDGDNLMREYCGSPYYAAPEMVTATPYEGQPADMWSCGVILYSMLSGTLPFQSEVMPNLFKLICNVDYVPLYTSSIEACDLIGGLLRSDPKDRLTAEECLAHPWFTSTEAPTEPKSTSCHNPILYEKANICEEANTCEKPSILSSPINKVTRKAVPKSISDIEIKNSIVRSHEMHQILEELERIKEYKNYEKYIELKGNDTLDTTKGVQKKDPAIGIIVIKLDGDELGEKKNIEEEENQERAGLKEEQQERAGLKEEQQERAGLKEEQQERAGLKEEASKKERKKSRREQDRYRREHRKFLKEEEKLKKEEDKVFG